MKKENIIIPNCSETELLIDEYLEGMIQLKDKEQMDEHMKDCSDCREYMKENEQLIKNLKLQGDENPYMTTVNKNEYWNKIEKQIDFNRHVKMSEEAAGIKSGNTDDGFFSRYKYILTGIAAALVIFVFYYIIKNTDTSRLQLADQNLIGLPTYWKVSSLKGTPLIGDIPVSSSDSIKEGQFILTNDTSKAELIIASLGKVIIEPNSKVVFIKGADGNNRIAVEYGTIEADMKSHNNEFFVELPSAVATDTKGNYKLTIDPAGDGLVYVTSGNVEIKSQNREAIVPAGNFVMTKKNIGVGTPFNENSSLLFKKALAEFDFGKCGETCVNTLIKTAKPTDAVSLVNMIPIVDDKYKDKVYTMAANFVTPPENVSHDSLFYYDDEKVKVWVYKIQEDVNKHIEKTLKDIEKYIEKDIEKNLVNLKEIEKLNFDTLQWLDKFNEFDKNWEYNFEKLPEKNMYKFEYDGDTAYFNKEEFDKNMKELREELKDLNKDLKENLDLNKEELDKEMKEMKEEIREALKDVKKDSLMYKKIIEEIQKNIPAPVVIPDVKDTEPEVPDAPEIKTEKEEDNKNDVK